MRPIAQILTLARAKAHGFAAVRLRANGELERAAEQLRLAATLLLDQAQPDAASERAMLGFLDELCALTSWRDTSYFIESPELFLWSLDSAAPRLLLPDQHQREVVHKFCSHFERALRSHRALDPIRHRTYAETHTALQRHLKASG